MSSATPDSNRPVVITGCQRSGTTLMHLILNSHPDIHGVDESEFDDARRDEYLYSAEFAPVVSFKLPRVAFNPAYIRSFPDARTLWCVRDPRDVVSSMLRLRLPMADGSTVSWAAHPHGAEYELRYTLAARRRGLPLFRDRLERRFAGIRRVPPAERTREDLVFLAALCWRLKNELYFQNRTVLHAHLVRYERLVADPRGELTAVVRAIGVEWSERLLQHHRLHQGTSIGETDNTRAIDATNTRKWEGELSPEELRTVGSICSATATRFGYDLREKVSA